MLWLLRGSSLEDGSLLRVPVGLCLSSSLASIKMLKDLLDELRVLLELLSEQLVVGGDLGGQAVGHWLVSSLARVGGL